MAASDALPSARNSLNTLSTAMPAALMAQPVTSEDEFTRVA